jgi:hypothetical protein
LASEGSEHELVDIGSKFWSSATGRISSDDPGNCKHDAADTWELLGEPTNQLEWWTGNGQNYTDSEFYISNCRDTDSDPNEYSDSDPNEYSDSGPNEYSDSDPNGYSNSGPNGYSNSGPNGYPDSGPNGYSDTSAIKQFS